MWWWLIPFPWQQDIEGDLIKVIVTTIITLFYIHLVVGYFPLIAIIVYYMSQLLFKLVLVFIVTPFTLWRYVWLVFFRGHDPDKAMEQTYNEFFRKKNE